jgi:hypothetical protein
LLHGLADLIDVKGWLEGWMYIRTSHKTFRIVVASTIPLDASCSISSTYFLEMIVAISNLKLRCRKHKTYNSEILKARFSGDSIGHIRATKNFYSPLISPLFGLPNLQPDHTENQTQPTYTHHSDSILKYDTVDV